MSYEFESHVAGIPCIVRVTSYHAGRPARLWGRFEDCYPEEYPEAEVEVCDRRGRPAAWLERKLDSNARAELEREAIEHIQSEREEY